jgi:L-serine dehydratase
MPNTRPVSAFDVIGPIMVGPSSSHTAGAVRIGRIARTVLGGQPEHALIELHGSFAETGRGHGTDLALVAGLLDLETDDPHIRDSFDLAAEAGMKIEFTIADLGTDANPNSVRLTMEKDGRSVRLIGSSVGGGRVEICCVQDYEIQFSGENETLLVVAEDRPGTINQVTGLLLEHHVNIAFLQVGRRKRGGEAAMVYETDDVIPPALVEAIEAFPWVRWVREIPSVTG